MKNKKKKLYLIKLIIILCCIYLIYIINENNLINKKYGSMTIIKEEKSNVENVKTVDKSRIKKTLPISFNASIPIFMYHWIKDDTGDYPWPENMIKPDTLKNQVEYLVENNFDFIYITDIENIYNYSKPVALTFDDGWEDVYIHMFPLAKEYNIKYSMYIIKDMVGKPGYCNEEQIKEMIESGLVDIQSHTVTHPYLEKLEYDNQKYELKESKEYLKNVYNVDSKVICYPYGSYNEDTINLSNETGYLFGLKMNGGIFEFENINYKKFEIPRIYAYRTMSLEEFIDYANKSKVEVIWEK